MFKPRKSFLTPLRIRIPFLLDLIVVSDPKQIKKIETSGDVDRLHTYDTISLPWWVKFYFQGNKDSKAHQVDYITGSSWKAVPVVHHLPWAATLPTDHGVSPRHYRVRADSRQPQADRRFDARSNCRTSMQPIAVPAAPVPDARATGVERRE